MFEPSISRSQFTRSRNESNLGMDAEYDAKLLATQRLLRD